MGKYLFTCLMTLVNRSLWYSYHPSLDNLRQNCENQQIHNFHYCDRNKARVLIDSVTRLIT